MMTSSNKPLLQHYTMRFVNLQLANMREFIGNMHLGMLSMRRYFSPKGSLIEFGVSFK